MEELINIRKEFKFTIIEVSTILKPIERTAKFISKYLESIQIQLDSSLIDVSKLESDEKDFVEVASISIEDISTIPDHQSDSLPSKIDTGIEEDFNEERNTEKDMSFFEEKTDIPNHQVSDSLPSKIDPGTSQEIISCSEQSISFISSDRNAKNKSSRSRTPQTTRSRTPISNDQLISLMINSPFITRSSRQIGIDGETDVEERLRKLFPELELINTSKLPHSCDLHLMDRKRSILFAIEVKLKKAASSEDVTKFERDVKEMTETKTDFKIIGLFISLSSGVPRYGEIHITSDKCYLANRYTADECIFVAIRMYQSIENAKIKDSLKIQNKAHFEIPRNVFRLLAELRSQYTVLHATANICHRQIELNNESNNAMHDLLSKLEVQRQFITFINEEFKPFLGEEAILELSNIEEDRLKEYVRSHTKRSIKKSEIISNFPSLTDVHKMSLTSIWAKYGL